MASIVDHFADHINASGVTEGGEWSVFAGYQPPSPNKCIVLYEYSGETPETSFVATYPRLQIRVRGEPNDYAVTRDKAEELFNLLHATSLDLSAISPVEELSYPSVYALQNPFLLQRDENERPEFVFNLKTMRA